ncbi:MAG: GNAT family N-acetyltransferase [Nitrospirae bacterium]|nr:GNAT family N-acetyltransferase [Nitrospirota bacterium]
MDEFGLIDEDKPFRDLATGWNDLHRAADHPTPFMSWEWASGWWDFFGSGRLHVVAFHRGGRLSGLAPLYRCDGPWGLSTLRQIGAGQSDYLDFLIGSDAAEKGYGDLILAVLTSSDSDLILLEQVPPNRLATLRDRGRSTGSYLQVKERGHCYIAELPPRWEDYLAGLGSNERYNIGRRSRTLEKQHGVVFRRYDQPGDDLDRKMDDFFDLMVHRLTMRGRVLAADEEVSRGFHKSIAQRFAAKGWLSLGALEKDGRMIAGLLSFEYGGTLFYYHSGFDPAWAKYSVGMVLMAKCIEDGIGRGLRQFDFMRGRAAYKMKWKVEERSFYRVVITRSMTGYLKFLGHGLTSRLQKNIGRWAAGRGVGRVRSEKADSGRDERGA